MKSAKFVVHGRVQGVGFRWFVHRFAMGCGLAGWVANRPDGAVEVVASGPDEQITDLERLLRTGPSGANVTSVELHDLTVGERPSVPFEIKR